MASSDDYDSFVKIITLGNTGVGKTSLMLRFCQDKFSTSCMSTIGTELTP